MASETSIKIPVKTLSSGYDMLVIALGTYEPSFDPKKAKAAFIEAVKIGYRHFDTAALIGTESTLGQAIAEAMQLGLIRSRADVFITTKLWCTDNHPELVVPAIITSLSNLKMDYVDLYLIHWPISVKPGPKTFPFKPEEVTPLNLKGVWEAMEECQKLGLTRSIGVSNFTTKKLEDLLQFAKIPPAVNQISLRWILEQGPGIVVKSFNKERLIQNLEIFDWKLTEEEHAKISSIPQKKVLTTEFMLVPEESLTSVDFSDIDIMEA